MDRQGFGVVSVLLKEGAGLDEKGAHLVLSDVVGVINPGLTRK